MQGQGGLKRPKTQSPPPQGMRWGRCGHPVSRWGSPSEVSAAIRRVADPQELPLPDAQVSPESACATSEQDPRTFVWTASLGITTRSVPRRCRQVQTTIRQENFAACAARPPAGFEVRRFVRVLSRETAALARCPMTGALRLPSAPYPPACAGESDTSPVVLRRPGDICRQAPLPSGLQRPATLRPSDSVGSPFSHSRVESRPEATPVVPVLPG